MGREQYVVVPAAQLFRHRLHFSDVPVLIPHSVCTEILGNLGKQ